MTCLQSCLRVWVLALWGWGWSQQQAALQPISTSVQMLFFLNLKCLSSLSLSTLLAHQETLPLTCDKRAVLEANRLEFKPRIFYMALE